MVLHASGSSEGLALAMRVAAFEATVVELSWYGDRAVTVPLGQAFHSQRLTLKSSQVGTVADSRRARWRSFAATATGAFVAGGARARCADQQRESFRRSAARDG